MKNTKDRKEGKAKSKSVPSKPLPSKGKLASKSSAPAKSAVSKKSGASSKGPSSKSKEAIKNAPAKGSSLSKKNAPAKVAAPKRAASGSGSLSKKAKGISRSASNGRPQSANDLDKIFKDLLKDIYWAEKQLLKGLGKMSKNATNAQLKDAFSIHKTQTEDQVQKLDKVFAILGMKAQGKKCAAMEGLLEEANEHLEEYEKGPGLDAALIVGAQKVEHYEIAAYGSLRAFAKTLGQDECSRIFEQIREQESDTDELLTSLAQTVNNEAVGSHQEEGGQSGKSSDDKSGSGDEDKSVGGEA